MVAEKAREIDVPLRAPGPKSTDLRATVLRAIGVEPDRAGMARATAVDPRPALRRVRISGRLDRRGPPVTTGTSDLQIVPEMSGIASGIAATIKVVPPAHHERERQG